MDDPHLNAVGLFQTYSHPEAGHYVAMRPPVTFSATPGDIRRHPPRLGEHNEELMAEAEAILAARNQG
jgi:crotonobetainyl-CoA:carnitine CoA-transferase CaiB-like acyl-CoA transferase